MRRGLFRRFQFCHGGMRSLSVAQPKQYTRHCCLLSVPPLAIFDGVGPPMVGARCDSATVPCAASAQSGINTVTDNEVASEVRRRALVLPRLL